MPFKGLNVSIFVAMILNSLDNRSQLFHTQLIHCSYTMVVNDFCMTLREVISKLIDLSISMLSPCLGLTA